MRQGELFSIAPVSSDVPGFRIDLEYISADEERQLLAHIDEQPWQSDYRRRIQQYGLGYAPSGGRNTTWVRDFPSWLMPLAERVAADARFERFPENCVINEYVPPQGIAPHTDYRDFGPKVACVSLGSDIVMDLLHPARGLRASVHVPARSLWLLEGEARTEWEHGIAPRLHDVIAGERHRRERRVSVTFRTGRQPAQATGLA
jgi:alkylated DNA repair dioxygenase AlkB